jgi:hypothetical protein
MISFKESRWEAKMAVLKIERKRLVKPESAYLHEFAGNITSQTGEDGIREKIFEIIGVRNKWCVEFGAWDGKQHSTTWSLLNDHGWRGVLIEGDEKKYLELKNNYAGNSNVFLFNKYVDIADGENSLDAILKQVNIPVDFDFLTIDVDGVDWHLWNSLSSSHPRLVLIEFNPTIPNHVYFVQDADMSLNQGSSLLSMIDLGKKKGYELVATTPWNAFFVQERDFPLFHIEDNSIDAMHSLGDFESTIFQLYDGTLVLGGCTYLIWKSVPIHQNDIQVLPVGLRKFVK